MASSKSLDIIVIGGSLGGLMSSVALSRLGHNVRILERSPSPLLHDQGAGIVMGGDMEQFLSSFDITRTPSYVQSRERLYLNKAGDVVRNMRGTQRMTSWDLLYNILRVNLGGVSTPYVKEPFPRLPKMGCVAFQHASTATSVRDLGDAVEVSVEQGESLKADYVVIADGPSSHLRPLVSPDSSTRAYAGYVAFRGTVPESQLSPAASSTFVEKFAFQQHPHSQILAYTIPGRNGTTTPGSRLVNWVWYWTLDGDSPEFKETFTDREGKVHRFTLPPGNNISEKIWNQQKSRAESLLPPQFQELVFKTESPFVQAITDLEPPANGSCWVLGGKGVLVGDALAGFRPHTAASTNQAALHANLLHQVFSGRLTKEAYQEEVVPYAQAVQRQGVSLGRYSNLGNN